MPKLKTNRMAHKKIRANAKGKFRMARAYTSHNTAKKSSKKSRQLRGMVPVTPGDARKFKKMLPYA